MGYCWKKRVKLYPFGLKHKGYNNVINGTEHPYGYNGKEEQEELGINWHDYGARNYDASLGRWFSVDPLANSEKQISASPFAYANNNPILYIDPDGREWKTKKDDIAENDKYRNAMMSSSSSLPHFPHPCSCLQIDSDG